MDYLINGARNEQTATDRECPEFIHLYLTSLIFLSLFDVPRT